MKAVRSQSVVTEEGLRPAALLIENGRIKAVTAFNEIPEGVPIEDHGELIVMPGLVDCHVHVNEPGRTEWEGFETATAAAAAGGITTIVDMPLNSDPVTTTLAALKVKRAAAEGKLSVDCAFWGGVVPGNLQELEPMAQAGVVGFKCFMIHSGIEQFPAVGEADLESAMKQLAALGLPLIAHAELAPDAPFEGSARRYQGYLASRPGSMEVSAIRLLIELCRRTRCRPHIVHLSCAEALPDIVRAKADGLPLTVETCPHYLTFAAEEIEDGRTEFKCAPPIRSAENRERLWEGLLSGAIDFIVSDHSPCLPALKCPGEGDFQKAWGGISSVQFSLPAVWTQARRRDCEASDLAQWLCRRPADLVGLSRKGRLSPGADADFVVWDDSARFVLDRSIVRHRHDVTPYAGLTLKGVVQAAYLRGERIQEGSRKGVQIDRRAHALH